MLILVKLILVHQEVVCKFTNYETDGHQGVCRSTKWNFKEVPTTSSHILEEEGTSNAKMLAGSRYVHLPTACLRRWASVDLEEFLHNRKNMLIVEKWNQTYFPADAHHAKHSPEVSNERLKQYSKKSNYSCAQIDFQIEQDARFVGCSLPLYLESWPLRCQSFQQRIFLSQESSHQYRHEQTCLPFTTWSLPNAWHIIWSEGANVWDNLWMIVVFHYMIRRWNNFRKRLNDSCLKLVSEWSIHSYCDTSCLWPRSGFICQKLRRQG